MLVASLASMSAMGVAVLWGGAALAVDDKRRRLLLCVWRLVSEMLLILIAVGFVGMVLVRQGQSDHANFRSAAGLVLSAMLALFSATVFFVPWLGLEAMVPRLLRRAYWFVPSFLALVINTLFRSDPGGETQRMKRETNPSTRKWRNTAMLFLVIGLAYYSVDKWHGARAARMTKSYRGDGRLSLRPYYGLLSGGGGFEITFAQIRLNQTTNLTYRFAGLPHWHVDLNFSLTTEKDWDWNDHINAIEFEPLKRKYSRIEDLNGTIGVTLKEVHGAKVIEYRRRIRDLVWSRSAQGPWRLYDSDHPAFIPKPDATYVLELVLEPDAALNDSYGNIVLTGIGDEGFSCGF